MDLPIQLGYFILQYAKMKMLEFNYDFLDIYVDRADYMLLEMDNDSNYLCLSAGNMHEVIKPNMRDIYEHHLRGYCRDDACPPFFTARVLQKTQDF